MRRRDDEEVLTAAELAAATAARVGVRPSLLAEDSDLVRNAGWLLAVEDEKAWLPLNIVLEFEQMVLHAVTQLGDNPTAAAARCLFGVEPGTRGRLRKHRREAAASAMGLVVETFTKHHEAQIIADLAVELYRVAVQSTAVDETHDPHVF